MSCERKVYLTAGAVYADPGYSIDWLVVALIQLACVGRASGEIFPITQSATGAVTISADIESLRKQALDEAEAGKTDAAIRDYQRALELQPEWKEGLWNLGMLLYSS